jgi:glycosyltransferase involved in cell wall biosynthesis
MQPLVSVIIPVWNDWVGLEACLGALARQDLPRERTEILLVDDGSDRDLADLVGAIPGARLLQQPVPGSVRARNRGIAGAEAEVLAFTDSDCLPATAAEIVRHGGVAVCAAVSPYRATRNDVRAMVGRDRFLEVFVDTPLEVCESRDAKGMYARARRGEIRGFTGLDDPCEPPEHPELVLDTVAATAEENAARALALLHGPGFTGAMAPPGPEVR